MRDPMPKAQRRLCKRARAIRRAIKARTTLLCPECGVRRKLAGMADHRKDAHGVPL